MGRCQCCIRRDGNYGEGDNDEAKDSQFLLCTPREMRPKILISSPVTVFLNHGQLDLSKVSDSISHHLTSLFPENCQIFGWVGRSGGSGWVSGLGGLCWSVARVGGLPAWVSRPEPPTRSQGPEGP